MSSYIEAHLDNTGTLNNNSPKFTTIPVVYACTNTLFNFNHGGIDSDGDSLVFSMITPFDDFGIPVTFDPPASATYPIIDNRGFNTFDPSTGATTFNPNGAQVALTAVLVEEYRNGVLIGSTMRDLQIIVINCNNSQPGSATGITNPNNGILVDSNTINACSSDSLSFVVTYSDPDASNQISFESNIGLVIPGATLSVVGTNPAVCNFQHSSGKFRWQKNLYGIG